MKNEKLKQIDTIINGFTAYLKQQYSLQPASINRHILEINPFFSFLTETGITDIKEVTTLTIKKYRKKVLLEKIADTTKTSKIRAVKRLFDHLTETNCLLLNPAEGIKGIKIDRQKPKETLTPKEITGLLSQPDTGTKQGVMDHLILTLLITTGIRTRELISIDVYDLDLSKGQLYVKNHRTNRTRAIHLSEEIIKGLSRYLENIRPERNKHRPSERALFLGKDGARFKKVFLLLGRYKKKAKIKKTLTCAVIRDTLVFKLLKEKKNIEDISKLLGHKSVKNTHTTYILYQKKRQPYGI